MKKLLLLIYIFGLTISGFAQDMDDDSIQGGANEFQGLIGVYNDQITGKQLASGETYNPELLTAAHNDLPFGTQLRVTNFANGRSIVVKVNDRGTKNKGRVLEVSKKAAQALDFIREGVAYVKVDILSDTAPINPMPEKKPTVDARMTDDEMTAEVNDNKPQPEPQNPPVGVVPPQQETPVPDQILDPQGAEQDTQAVNKVNPEAIKIQPKNEKLSVNRIFVIQFGAFSTQEKAQAFQQTLAAKGIKTYYAKEGQAGSELYKVRESNIYRDIQEVFSKVLDYKNQNIDCFAVGKFFVQDQK